jgi:hypothetical protein
MWNYHPLKTDFHTLVRFAAIQNVPGGNVSILGGHSIGHSKQQIAWTVSEIELFHSTVAKLLIMRCYVLFIVSVLFKWQNWYCLPSTIHFRKFHRQQQQWHYHRRSRTAYQHTGICEGVRHFAQHSCCRRLLAGKQICRTRLIALM